MRILTAILILVCSLSGFSQRAEMTIDKPQLTIGEQTVVRIRFEYPNPNEDALIGWPQFDKFLAGPVEIIDKTVDYESLADSLNQVYLREQQLTVTVFEPGDFTIPGQAIELNDSVYQTNELLLTVSTVEVDTSKGVVDIKAKYEVEYPFSERAADWFKENWHWFAFAGLAIALFFVFRILRNRKGETPEPEAPKIPAHITALSVLHELLQNERWKQPDKKEYYSTLTDTVRRYLEDRFNIYAMEQTTREILENLKKADISDEDKVYLRRILGQADMVKFAKFKPSDEDGLLSLQRSIEFVDRTRKEEEKEASSE